MNTTPTNKSTRKESSESSGNRSNSTTDSNDSDSNEKRNSDTLIGNFRPDLCEHTNKSDCDNFATKRYIDRYINPLCLLILNKLISGDSKLFEKKLIEGCKEFQNLTSNLNGGPTNEENMLKFEKLSCTNRKIKLFYEKQQK
jgi:hypothetical protein